MLFFVTAQQNRASQHYPENNMTQAILLLEKYNLRLGTKYNLDNDFRRKECESTTPNVMEHRPQGFVTTPKGPKTIPFFSKHPSFFLYLLFQKKFQL